MFEPRFGRSVGRATLNNWVYELGGLAKTPLEVSAELQPRWGGFLGIDGKAIYIKGNKHCLLIGVDNPTQDIVHALVLEAETAEGFSRLETEARLDAGYPLYGVVSDFAPGFAQAHRDHFGAVPFQACRVHFDRRLDSDIPKKSWTGKAPLYVELKNRIRAVLYADSFDEAHALLRNLVAERSASRTRDALTRCAVSSATSISTPLITSCPGCPPTTTSPKTSSSSSTRSCGSWRASRASSRLSATCDCSSAATAPSVSRTHAAATASPGWSLPESISRDSTGFPSFCFGDQVPRTHQIGRSRKINADQGIYEVGGDGFEPPTPAL
jgi:hypothetical protein